MAFALTREGLCVLAVAATLAAVSPCVAQDPAAQAAAPEAAAQGAAPEAATPTFKPEEIEQLVAPIALYPDPLLAQIFMASTYPLEIVEAARWQKEHPDLKDKALEEALQSQPWDASVKSLVAFPQVLTMMNEKLDWTQNLGDACLAQQDEVMVAVQRLRSKAKAAGNLETTDEQKVTVSQEPVKVEQNVTVQQAPPPETTIKIEPADPQVVYVPTYNPTIVYGGWPYPSYPPYTYYPPGYVAATSIMSFGAGMAVGAALWGDCDWDDCCGGGDDIKIDVDNYNSFNKTNIKNGNWQHRPEHRKGVGYRDGATQQRFGKGGQQARNQAAARESFRGRAASGRQELARSGGAERARQQVTAADRARQGGQRPQAAQARDRTAAGGAGERARAGGQRQTQPQRRDAATRQQSGRSSGAFQGMGSSGQEVRRQSDRGRASRQSAMGRGGGGRGGGGGSRSGGGGRGGGGRRR